MPWIESHTVLLRHRKVLQLATDLSLPPVQILGHLHALWHAVLEQQEDGNLTAWPNVMIARAAAYEGDADVFVTSLVTRKWLDGKLIHDWLEYAGRYLTVKYRTANPRRLRQIFKLYKTVYRQTQDGPKTRLKTDNLTRPNPSEPNQPNPPKERRDEFDKLWEAYPWKAGKQEAEKAWTKLNGICPSIDQLLTALAQHKRSRKWTKDDGEYIPRLSVWLNQQRWNDDMEVSIQAPPSTLPKSFQKIQTESSLSGIDMPKDVRDELTKGGILKPIEEPAT